MPDAPLGWERHRPRRRPRYNRLMKDFRHLLPLFAGVSLLTLIVGLVTVKTHLDPAHRVIVALALLAVIFYVGLSGRFDKRRG